MRRICPMGPIRLMALPWPTFRTCSPHPFIGADYPRRMAICSAFWRSSPNATPPSTLPARRSGRATFGLQDVSRTRASRPLPCPNIPHLLTTPLYRRGLPAPNGPLLGVLEKLAERVAPRPFCPPDGTAGPPRRSLLTDHCSLLTALWWFFSQPFLYLGRTHRTIHDTPLSARIKNIKNGAPNGLLLGVLEKLAERECVRSAWWQGRAVAARYVSAAIALTLQTSRYHARWVQPKTPSNNRRSPSISPSQTKRSCFPCRV